MVGVAKRSLAGIKAGDYVAPTSVKGADGSLTAARIIAEKDRVKPLM